MKTSFLNILTAALMVPCAVFAGSRSSANYSVPADTVDAGGRKTSSASYSNDGSLGGIGGISSAAAPVTLAKHSYIGQLYDLQGLVLSATPISVNEGATRQLNAVAQFDDATTLNLSSSAPQWSVVSGPIQSINAAGLATAGVVYENTPATVRADYSGLFGTLDLKVLDVDPDNFGSYAGDGLPDIWQVQNFGLNNPRAGPTNDPDGDNQNNRFEYIAGTNPNDAASRFRLSIELVPGQPTRKNLVFSPRLADRTYTAQFKLDLGAGAFADLAGTSTSDVGPVRTVTDLNATQLYKFYRVQITFP